MLFWAQGRCFSYSLQAQFFLFIRVFLVNQNVYLSALSKWLLNQLIRSVYDHRFINFWWICFQIKIMICAMFALHFDFYHFMHLSNRHFTKIYRIAFYWCSGHTLSLTTNSVWLSDWLTTNSNHLNRETICCQKVPLKLNKTVPCVISVRFNFMTSEHNVFFLFLSDSTPHR